MLWRQVIRDTTVALLSGQTDAETRVYTSPVLPLRRERPLPTLSVYTLNEVTTPLGESGPFELQHDLDLSIECVVELATPPDWTEEQRLKADVCAPLDRLCEQVDRCLQYNVNWYQPLKLDIVRRTTRTTVGQVSETDRRTATAVMIYTVVYTEIVEPDIPDELLYVDLQVDVIDPACDPNTEGHPTDPPDGYPGGCPGPDGRIEVHLRVPKTGTLWPVLSARTPAEWRELWNALLFPRRPLGSPPGNGAPAPTED
jgi:hypothetical protein